MLPGSEATHVDVLDVGAGFPEKWIHKIERRRMLRDGQAFTELCFSDPEAAKDQLRETSPITFGPICTT